MINLASELRENGVDVILDKWDLKEGHDAVAFMEQMVTDPAISKVVIVCDQKYAEKADGRSGGVGTETQIISPEIYAKRDQEKFVVVVSEKDENGKPFLPTYYSSRIYIDLSDEAQYATNFDQLLRWVYDKPLHIKPELGKKPAFLEHEASEASLGGATVARRALDAIRNNKAIWAGSLDDYFSRVSENLERFRITSTDGEFDDQVVESIEQFLPHRNEIVEVFMALSQYLDHEEVATKLHRFFEGIYEYTTRPETVTTYREWDFDNYYFITHELFIYAIAALLKYERFENVGYLLRTNYYVSRRVSETDNGMIPFSRFRKYMRSLEHRNQRLGLRRLSLRADLLEQRSHTSGLDFAHIMQADFALYLRDCLDALRAEGSQTWWPETLLYVRHGNAPFEIFARSQSSRYFDRVKTIFDVESARNFDPVVAAYRDQTLRVPRWEFESFSPESLMGYENLCTKP